MAQAITAPMRGAFVAPPGNNNNLADQTGTTANFAPTNAFTYVCAQIALKTFTAGTGTARPIFEIQAADDSAYTSNVRKIALAQCARTSNTHLYLEGMCLDGSKANVRVVPTLDGTDSITYDVKVQCS